MSIISDALARLQSERGSSKSGAAEGSEQSESPASSPESSSSIKAPPRKRIVPSRGWVIGVISALLLFGLGLGSFWWGLTLVPDVPQVTNAPDPPTQVAALPSPETTVEVISSEEENETEPLAKVVDTPSVDPAASEEAVPARPSALQESPPIEVLALEKKEGPRKLSPQAVGEESPSPSPPIKKAPLSPNGTTSLEKKNLASVSPPNGKQKSPVSSESTISPKTVQKGNATVSDRTGKRASSKESTRVASPRPKRVLSTQQKLVLAQRLIGKHRYDQAVTVLGTVMTSSPEEWEPWFWMGTAKLGQGNIKEADEYFIEGLARNGNIPQLWVQRALVGQQEGRYGEAIDLLRQAELLAPDLPEIPLNLAYSFETQGNRQLAIQHYRKFLTMTEGNASYRSARKTVLIRVDHLNQT